MNMDTMLLYALAAACGLCAGMIFLWLKYGKRKGKIGVDIAVTGDMDINKKLLLITQALTNLNNRVKEIENRPVVVSNGTKPKGVSLEEALQQAQTLKVGGNGHSGGNGKGNGNGNGDHSKEEITEAPVQTEGEPVPTQAESSDSEIIRTKITEILQEKPMRTGEIAKICNVHPQKISRLIAGLYKAGTVAKNFKEEWVLSKTSVAVE